MSKDDDLYRAILEHNMFPDEEREEKKKRKKSKSGRKGKSRGSYETVSAVTIGAALILFIVRIITLIAK